MVLQTAPGAAPRWPAAKARIQALSMPCRHLTEVDPRRAPPVQAPLRHPRLPGLAFWSRRSLHVSLSSVGPSEKVTWVPRSSMMSPHGFSSTTPVLRRFAGLGGARSRGRGPAIAGFEVGVVAVQLVVLRRKSASGKTWRVAAWLEVEVVQYSEFGTVPLSPPRCRLWWQRKDDAGRLILQ